MERIDSSILTSRLLCKYYKNIITNSIVCINTQLYIREREKKNSERNTRLTIQFSMSCQRDNSTSNFSSQLY